MQLLHVLHSNLYDNSHGGTKFSKLLSISFRENVFAVFRLVVEPTGEHDDSRSRRVRRQLKQSLQQVELSQVCRWQ
jgi:hypothetical protein